MSFFSQVADLFSQYPGSLIYQLVILFSIEAALGIALGYRKQPAVRRIVLATSGMLISRLALMVVALLAFQGLLDDPNGILPPLERAVDAIGTWLLIWALLPLFDNTPQWGDLLAGCVTLLLIVLYIFFAVAWYSDVTGAAGDLAYNSSYQASVWEAIQLGLLAAAGVFTLMNRTGDWALHLGILVVLLSAHLIQFGWGSTEGSAASWVRLGQLIAYPLFTVATYRLVVGQLMEDAARTPATSLIGPVEKLRQVTSVTATMDEPSLIKAAVVTVARVTGAEGAALLLLGGDHEEGLDLEQVAAYSDGKLVLDPQGHYSLDDVPALRRTLNHRRPVFLRPGGSDDSSRLSLLVQLLPEANLEDRLESALMIQPVCEESHLYGALLAAYTRPAAEADDWSLVNRQLVDLLATQLAVSLSQARAYQRLQDQVTQLGAQAGTIDGDAASKLEQLQVELSEAKSSEQDLARQLDHAQQELTRTQRWAEDLVGLVDQGPAQLDDLGAAAVMWGAGRQARMADFQSELEAATAEPGAPLSDDGQVEGTGERAEGHSLVLPGRGQEQGPAARVIQELRQPIASIVGYTDLLLGESVGTVGDLQRVFLQRVKASSERARVLLDDLAQVVDRRRKPIALELGPTDVDQTVQDAVLEFSDQVEEKNIDLKVDLQGSVPMLELDQDVLDQIIYHLLSNALRVSDQDGTVAVEVRYQDGEHMMDDQGRETGYLFMSVTDSGGGIEIADQPHVFDRHYRAKHSQIEGLGNGGMGLPLVSELVKAHGGRVWVESESESGNAFSLVLPVSVAVPER